MSQPTGIELKRGLSIDAFKRKRFKTIQLEDKWKSSIGPEVELSGSWIVFGDPGNGKTSFVLQLVQMLTGHGKVAYDTLEEGDRFTFQKSIKRIKWTAIQQRRIIILKESISELRVRLRKPKSANIIIIDSLQYSLITKTEFMKLMDDFPEKLFIWISHTDGKRPKGAIGEWVWYAADVKVFVEGFKAFITSRYEGLEPYIINEDRASQYWGDL